jgi:hypothetical protein
MTDEKEFERWLRRQRREDRQAAVEFLVEAALLYHEESQRDDAAHKARLSRRLDQLTDAIKYTCGTLEPSLPAGDERDAMRRRWERTRGP